jgi:anti-anti-sigma factor
MGDEDDGFALEVVEAEGSPLVRVRGELDVATAQELGSRLTELIGGMPDRITIDLSDTVFMDCSGARPICEARRQLPIETCRIVLLHPRPLIRMVLNLVGLDGPCLVEG